MTEATPQDKPVQHPFQAEVSQVLDLVIHSLYSHKEIFLRELVSNASDALDKLRFAALTDGELMGSDPALEIRIRVDKTKKTLTIEDTGIGMTEAELVKNLGTVAHSGSRAFLEQVKAAKKDGAAANEPGLIGRFGVGFYSSYLVADKVVVTTRHAARGERALVWTSDAKSTFTIEPGQRAERGTEVVLHLKDDQLDFLDPHTLEGLVKRYSDYVAYPIKLEDRQINRASALWQRPKTEVSEEQYAELYTHLTHDGEAPLAHTHFRVEGAQEFVGLLYVPRHAPFDLFDVKRSPGGTSGRGVRLFVRRVFIMDDVEELVPPWLRFLRGVVDSDDLPLNVSRELLQDSAALRAIKRQVTKKTLDLLDETAAEEPEDYATFWRAFGVVLKEGLAMDNELLAADRYGDRLAKLLRFESTDAPGALTSLPAYVARMKEKQDAIYYAFGESKKAIEGSPYLEAVRARGFEVLYLTDPIDEWAVQAIPHFEEKKLVSVMRADLPLDTSEEEKREKERMATALEPLLKKLKELLGDRVREVKVSDRLTDSPCCLVLPGNASPAFMERLLRDRGRDIAHGKRILELNPTHPLVLRLLDVVEKSADDARLEDWVEVLYDQAVLAEGGVPDDPNLFARRIATLLTDVASIPVR
jgi:molecular chaperone HtpG